MLHQGCRFDFISAGVVVLSLGSSACASSAGGSSTSSERTPATVEATGPGFVSLQESLAFSPVAVVATVGDQVTTVEDPVSVPLAVAQTYSILSLRVESVLRGPEGLALDLPLVVSNDLPGWEVPPAPGTRALFLLNPRTAASVPGVEVPDPFFNLATGGAAILTLDGDRIVAHSPDLRFARVDHSGSLDELDLAMVAELLRSLPPGLLYAQNTLAAPVRGYAESDVTVAP